MHSPWPNLSQDMSKFMVLLIPCNCMNSFTLYINDYFFLCMKVNDDVSQSNCNYTIKLINVMIA